MSILSFLSLIRSMTEESDVDSANESGIYVDNYLIIVLLIFGSRLLFNLQLWLWLLQIFVTIKLSTR
jgi:hypothetical protein